MASHYRYIPGSDKISIAPITLPSVDVITKRSVPSFNAKIFDPLSLYSPVTNSRKVVMRELSQSEEGYDEKLS